MLPIESTTPRTPVVEPPGTQDTSTRAMENESPLRIGTYNLAGGNDTFNSSCLIDATTRTLAEQVVGGVDVVALQEVSVGTERAGDSLPAGIDDYNEYALAQVSAQAQGLQGVIGFTPVRTVDGNGQPATIIYGVDAEGRSSQVTITREHYTSDGTRMPFDLGGLGIGSLDATVTVYNADVQTPEGVQDYTAVFGSSTARDGGDYGNAVLLGPRATLQRDADGNAMVARHVLGEDPQRHETRTALQVGIDVGGEQATVFSAHLTQDNDADAAASEREAQVATLGELAGKTGDNTLLLGDFNDERFDWVGTLSGSGSDENRVDPLVKAISDRANNRDDTNIDRIYVSGDVSATDRQERIFDGGSDHELVSWQVDLDT